MALVAGKQVAIPDIADLTSEQFQKTFAINVFALFWLTQKRSPATERCKYHHHFVNPGIPAKSAFTGLCGYEGGDSELQPWPGKQVAEKGIRVNIVAPGPIWTALQISGGQTQDRSAVWSANADETCGQPAELAPCIRLSGKSGVELRHRRSARCVRRRAFRLKMPGCEKHRASL